MMVIILGRNRAELCKVKIRDENKHFFLSRGQLYKVYPDGLRRMRIYDEGEEKESDEVIVYPENAIVPFFPGHVPYDMDRILAEIDEHKLVGSKGGVWPYRIYFTEARNVWREIGPMFPMLVAGIILAYAFLSG